MTTRRSGIFYSVLIALSSLVAGMVLFSRMDLAQSSAAAALRIPATDSAPIQGPIDSSTFRNIAHDQSPAVVSILVKGHRQGMSMDDLFGQMGGGRRGGGGGGAAQSVPIEGAGSGFVIDKTGFVLTNNHVIEDAESITVSFGDDGARNPDAQYPAKIIGRDELTDVALLQMTQLPTEPLHEVKFGDSDAIAPGDWVMAIGNPFELSNTVTVGVVSSIGHTRIASESGNGIRSEPMIQTDAAINKGNSGGPLFNIRGEVIGINTMIVSDNEQGGNIGIGFAIPINRVRGILGQLRTGKVVRGRIGVEVGPVTKSAEAEYGLSDTSGALVSGIDPDGPAKAAGIHIEDVIVEFNGKHVKDRDDLIAMVYATTPGATVPVQVIREKRPVTVNVKVGEVDLAAEQEQQAQSVAPTAAAQPAPAPKATGFGMSISNISDVPDRIKSRMGISASAAGVVITDVQDFSPANDAGLQTGMLIVGINGERVTNTNQASAALDKVASGRDARIIVSVGGQERLVLVHKP